MIFTIIRNRNEAREEFEKFISKSVEILAGDEMKMNIHKDKMLWYNTKYCIRTSDERSWNMGKDLKGKELGLWISAWLRHLPEIGECFFVFKYSIRGCIYALHFLNMCKDIFWSGIKMIFTTIRNRNEEREEFEKFISKSVKI